jgi:hypothetical protein
MGKRRDARLAKMVAEEVSKAGMTAGALQGIGATTVSADAIAPILMAMNQASGGHYEPLAREAQTFGGSLGPATPLIPFPLDYTSDPTGRADPRKYQYDVADNLNITKKLTQWNVLSSAATQVDLFARAISMRTADVTKMDWSFNVSQDAINTIMEDNNIGNAEASKIARKLNMAQIVKMSEFWENPYPQSDRSWEEWISEFMWQVLVYDGVPVHPHMSLGRDVLGFDIIEASTIKILLDNYGDFPRPPDPAFQQILWGFPRGEFTASSNKDAKNYMDGQFDISERDQLSYFVMNRRTNTPYGFSPTEQALEIGNIYMERLKWMMAEYKFGTKASVYLNTNSSDITLNNLTNYNRIINDWVQGSTANRQSHIVLPEGFSKPEFAPTVEEKYKENYDEYLIKRIASFYGVMPTQFGVIPRTGLGGKGASEGAQDETESVSIKPQNKYIERCINALCRRYLGANRQVTFTLQNEEGSQDEVEKANAAKIYASFGGKTLNTIQGELGLPLYDMPEADEPMVITPTGPVFLKGTLAAQIEANTPAEPGATDDQTPPSPSPQAPQEAQPKEQEGADSGQANAPDVKPDTEALKSGEAKAYRAYISKGRKRPFNFIHHTPEEAEELKAGLEPRPKSSLTKRKAEDHPSFHELTNAAKKHATALHVALTAAATGVGMAVTHALRVLSETPGANPGSIADLAVAQNISFDTSQAEGVLTQLYTVTAQMGAQAGADAAGTDIVGNRAITDLLAQRGYTLQGITDSSLKRISDTIAQGLANGDGHRAISDAVNSVIADPKRADVIAITEGNRSYNASFIDQLQQNGYQRFDWINDADPCDECEGQLGLHDISDAPPPEHPNCRCMAVAPTQ